MTTTQIWKREQPLFLLHIVYTVHNTQDINLYASVCHIDIENWASFEYKINKIFWKFSNNSGCQNSKGKENPSFFSRYCVTITLNISFLQNCGSIQDRGIQGVHSTHFHRKGWKGTTIFNSSVLLRNKCFPLFKFCVYIVTLGTGTRQWDSTASKGRAMNLWILTLIS